MTLITYEILAPAPVVLQCAYDTCKTKIKMKVFGNVIRAEEFCRLDILMAQTCIGDALFNIIAKPISDASCEITVRAAFFQSMRFSVGEGLLLKQSSELYVYILEALKQQGYIK